MTDVRYWDSCVYLRALQRGPDWQSVEAVLLQRENDPSSGPTIATCAITLVEVLNRKGEERLIHPDDFARAGSLLAKPFTMSVIPADQAVANVARDLVFHEGLRPMDAMHLAAALNRTVPVLETYDHHLLDVADRFANRIDIRRPISPAASRLNV